MIHGKRTLFTRLGTAAVALALAGAVPASIAQPKSAPGEAPEEALPSAESIFERYIEALGGRDKVMAVRNRRLSGTFDGAPFKEKVGLQMWQDAPSKFHVRVAEPAGIRIDLFSDGYHAWEMVTGRDPRWLTGVKAIELCENAQFYGEADYKSRYSKVETIRKIDYQGRPSYVVQASPPSGRIVLLIFDAETGMHRTTRTVVIEGGRERQIDVQYNDFVEVEGVKVPSTIVQRYLDDPDPIIWSFRSIELNSDEPHDYTPPETLGPRPKPVYVLASEQPEDTGNPGAGDADAGEDASADDVPDRGTDTPPEPGSPAGSSPG